MRQHPNTLPLPRISWQRQGLEWRLVSQGHVFAHIITDHRRWLCYTAADNGDDGLLGPAHSLAAAKRFLERRAAFAMLLDCSADEPPL